jgi:hypothetical protein
MEDAVLVIIRGVGLVGDLMRQSSAPAINIMSKDSGWKRKGSH